MFSSESTSLDLPQQFEHLKLEGSDLGYRKLKKSLEEKESEGKRRLKILMVGSRWCRLALK